MLEKKKQAEILFGDAIESQNYLDEGMSLTKLQIKKNDLVLGNPI